MPTPSPNSAAAFLVTAATMAAAAACLLVLAACSGSGGDSGDKLTVNGDVPLVYAKRSTAVGMNPTDGANSAPEIGRASCRERVSLVV